MSETQRNCATCAFPVTQACRGCNEESGSVRWKPRADASAAAQEAAGATNAGRKHSHYFKDVSSLKTVDFYRIVRLYEITDPCIQHALKKLLVVGGRGGGKNADADVQESIDALTRWQEMRAEDERGAQ